MWLCWQTLLVWQALFGGQTLVRRRTCFDRWMQSRRRKYSGSQTPLDRRTTFAGVAPFGPRRGPVPSMARVLRTSRGRRRSCRYPKPHAGRPHDRREESKPVHGRSGQLIDGVLGMRHDADDIAGRIANRSDIVHRAVRVSTDVASNDPAIRLEFVECRGIGDVPSFTVLNRNHDFLADAEVAEPR